MNRRRVVITGLGAVTGLGLSFEETWQGLISGKSGVGPITRFDPEGYRTVFAAQVPDRASVRTPTRSSTTSPSTR